MVEEIKLPTYEALLTEAIRSLAVDSGTVTSSAAAGTNILHDGTKNWAADVHKNRLVKIIRGAGAGQLAVIEGNTAKALVIKGSWAIALDTTSVYVILDKDLEQMLRDVFGGGSNISAANPLEVHDPKVEAVESKVDDIEAKLDAKAYTEDSTSGNSGGDGAWHDALDVDTRGMKSFSAVVINTNGANSLNWRLRARPSNYSAGADEEIPECPGSETLAPAEKGLAELIKAYSRIKIQVQDTVGGSAATYTIDYLINR